MLMRQARLRSDTGAEEIAWIDTEHAHAGTRLDLVAGDGTRSAPVTVVEAWMLERDRAEIVERQINQRSFGGSIH